MIPKYNIRQSETAVCKERLAPFCVGDGVDVGFGGDPIKPDTICMDLPKKYSNAGTMNQHLHGDCRCLYWFKDNVLDYVYSSHVLEDFSETKEIILEWLRVIKPGGNLVLFLPDEQLYREFCKLTNQRGNQHHVYSNFSFIFLKDIFNTIPNVEIIHHSGIVNFYCFEVVIRKM